MKHLLFPLLMAVAVGSACAATPINTSASVTQLSAGRRAMRRSR